PASLPPPPTQCRAARAFPAPGARLVTVHASKSAPASGMRGENARYPMRSPGIASDFDQDVATIERVTSGGISGTATSSNTSARYGSSLISTIGPAPRASILSISTNVHPGEITPPGLFGGFPRSPPGGAGVAPPGLAAPAAVMRV